MQKLFTKYSLSNELPLGNIKLDPNGNTRSTQAYPLKYEIAK